MKPVSTLIIGGGIAGVSTAWWLAQRGAQGVMLLEREASLGQHSSGLNAGILRTAIEAPETRALALETSAFLANPPQDFCAHTLVDGRGLVVVEGREGLPLPRWAPALQELGLVESLQLDQLEQLMPLFRPEGTRAWHFPSTGQIDIAALLASFAKGARAAGVDMRQSTAVESLIHTDSGAVCGVRLQGGETIEAERVVIAAGAWAGKLGASIGAHFPGRATRRHLFVTRADPRIQRDWPIVWDDAAGFYALPEGPGLMICMSDMDDVDPDSCHVDPLIRRILDRRLAHSLPSLEGIPIERTWAAMRTMAEDDRPVVGPDPKLAGLFWVAGLGGHGMSISAGLGRVAADIILGLPVDDELAAGLAPANKERAYAPLRDY
ncbi:MAG: D-arginine dehydrogenase [Planctomycetota bacterium]|jgi:D-arginine dehydrogenase